jgi:hypothetical protein
LLIFILALASFCMPFLSPHFSCCAHIAHDY